MISHLNDVGEGHPDDKDVGGIKSEQMTAALTAYSHQHGIPLSKIYIWYDYSCVDQV